MNKRSLILVSLLVVAPAFAQTELQEHQHEKNTRRRSRQAEAIQNLDNDQKVEAAQKAHERNQNARERQKDRKEAIDDR